jgi:hypothetical protein
LQGSPLLPIRIADAWNVQNASAAKINQLRGLGLRSRLLSQETQRPEIVDEAAIQKGKEMLS